MANNELNYQELFADIEWQSLVPYTPEHEPQSPLYQVAIRLKGDIRLILGLDKGKLQYAPKSDFHQDLAKFIKMARDPQVSKEWVPAVYISAMEKLWEKVIAAYSPNLTEEDLLTLANTGGREHLLLLLKRYQNEPPADQYTRIYLTVSGVNSDHNPTASEPWLTQDTMMEEIAALPKPREWPQGKYIVMLTVPNNVDISSIHQAIHEKKWSTFLPYATEMQISPWKHNFFTIGLSETNWDKAEFKRAYEENARRFPPDIIQNNEWNKEVQELIKHDPEFFEFAYRKFLQNTPLSDNKLGRLLHQTEGRYWFAITFNQGQNMICMTPGGKGSGYAILFEKQGDKIAAVAIPAERYAAISAGDQVPLSVYSRYPGTVVPPSDYATPSPEFDAKLQERRLAIQLAMYGKPLPGSESLLTRVQRLTDELTQEAKTAAEEEKKAAMAAQTAHVYDIQTRETQTETQETQTRETQTQEVATQLDNDDAAAVFELKNMLTDYIKRIRGEASDDEQIDFTRGLWHHKESRAVNRKLNYLLAKQLLQELNNGHSIASTFENIEQKRNELLAKNSLIAHDRNYIERKGHFFYHQTGVNSQQLNTIIDQAQTYIEQQQYGSTL